MLERPLLTDERIVAALREGYGLATARLEFLPLGNDSGVWSYRVETGTVKRTSSRSRRGVPDAGAAARPALLERSRD